MIRVERIHEGLNKREALTVAPTGGRYRSIARVVLPIDRPVATAAAVGPCRSPLPPCIDPRKLKKRLWGWSY